MKRPRSGQEDVPEFEVGGFARPGWAHTDFDSPLRVEVGQETIRLQFMHGETTSVRGCIRYGERILLWHDERRQVVALDVFGITSDQMDRCRATSKWMQNVSRGIGIEGVDRRESSDP